MFLDANKNPVKKIFISKTTQLKTLKAITILKQLGDSIT